MLRLLSNYDYLFIFLALAAYTTAADIFATPLEFTTTASISAVTMFSLFLSANEFEGQPMNGLITHIFISFVSYALMHLHEVVDWL